MQLTKTDWATEGVSFVANPSGSQPALQQFSEVREAGDLLIGIAGDNAAFSFFLLMCAVEFCL